MLELSLIFAFLMLKYAIPDTVASMSGKPTARTQDRLARQQAVALRAHQIRRGHLEPTLGEAVKARLVVLIAPRPDADQPRPAKQQKQPRPPGWWTPWLRALRALLAWLREWLRDAGEEAERRAVQARFERKNRRRERSGQPPIVIDVQPCPGCDTGTVSRRGQLCPACTAATPPPGPRPAPPPPAPPPSPPAPKPYVDPDTVPDLTPPAPDPDDTEPAQGPDPTREDADMTDPLVIDGDVKDPTGGLAHARGCVNLLGQLGGQDEICANNMADLGLGEDAVADVRGGADDGAEFLAEADRLIGVYKDHLRRADEFAARPDIAHTVDDTYLAGDRR